MRTIGATPALEQIAQGIWPDAQSGTFRNAARLAEEDAPPPHPHGSRLGAYRIIALIGEGGIGHVYLADHVKLGRRVALKVLRPRFSRDPTIVKRFFDEARAANQIQHENIVQITDFVEDAEQGSYLIMELLHGLDLEELLACEGLVTVDRAIRVMMQVADALACAHRAKIVHRDLKPENIFLTTRSELRDFVKILDFGIAKLNGDPKEDKRSTLSGAIVGTPAYMSPEQALGREVDDRTDIYSFGVILYELVTGRLPFVGETLGDFVIQHTTVVPPPPSKVPDLPHRIPERLESLIQRCLSKNRELRPETMAEVERELRAIAAQLKSKASVSTIPSPPQAVIEPPARLPTPAPRGAWKLVASGALICVVLVVLGGWTLLPARSGPPAVAVPSASPTTTPTATLPPPATEQPSGAAPSAAEAPLTVEITIESDPVGAEVIRVGESAPLGTTPLTLTLERENATAAIEIRAAGHDPITREVSLARDALVHVVLPPTRAVRRPSNPPSVRRAPPLGRRSVIDPFE